MAAPTFSYAQAARGLHNSHATPTLGTAEIPSIQGMSKPKDLSHGKAPAQTTTTQPKTQNNEASVSNNASTTSEKLPEIHHEHSADRETEIASSTQRPLSSSERQRALTQSDSSSPGIDAGTASTSVPDDDFKLLNGGIARAGTDSQESKEGARSASAQDIDAVAKDVEDDWDKVSIPSTIAEKGDKELKAAPVPTVNIWQQRREAQQAKAREVASHRAGNTTANTTTLTQSIKTSATPKERVSTEKRVAPQKQANSNSNPTDKKEQAPVHTTSGRAEKNATTAPPPVADAESWPTPDTAPAEDRRKSVPLEKSEKPEVDAPAQKTRSKQWVHVPFVPTAKFETQLPASLSRRGGSRTGNRGRDTNGRGGHAPANGPNVEKAETTHGSMGPPPLPKHVIENDRGRRSEGRTGRANSLPTSGRRADSKENLPIPNFGSSTVPRNEEGKNDESKVSSSTDMATPSSELNGELVPASRSSSRNKGFTSRSGIDLNLETKETSPSSRKDDSYVNPEQYSRQNFFPDRQQPPATGIPRGNGDIGRERTFAKGRDWSKEKPDAFREKVESWRDREIHGEYSSRRETRGERGRGGYRGRGNHLNYNNHYSNLHAFTAPLPQGGFEPSTRSSSLQESRSRQSSQPFVVPSTSTAARPNPRSHSIPVGIMYPPFFQDAPSMHQTMTPIQTETQGLGLLPQMPQMSQMPSQAGMMPFNEHLNSYAVMSMVAQQVEYYFSIDNLCKDMYLRQNMNSQGYVSLGVIAKFRRMQSLLGEQEAIPTLRYVCQSLRTVEYRPSENGDDMIRRREDWKSFVLPMEERKPEARDDGSLLATGQTFDPVMVSQNNRLDGGADGRFEKRTSSFMGFSPISSTSQTAFQALPVSQARLNEQSNGRPAELQRNISHTSTSSPLSPKQNAMHSPVPQNVGYPLGAPTMNGHRQQSIDGMTVQQGTFPDDKISEIMITCTQGEMGDVWSPSAEQFAETGTGTNDIPNLRGGAGSPQQLSEELQHLPYLQVLRTALKQRERGETELALKIIYGFWAEFLVDNFNSSMYKDFHETAVDDLQHGREMGADFLSHFYEKMLTTPRLEMSDPIARDVVELVRLETGDSRTMFQKLRLAWRNGATNLKTRKRLADHLTKEEKEVFDK